MSRGPSNHDRLIDEALRQLADGVPVRGLRGRVLTQIAGAADSASRHRTAASDPRLFPLRTVAIVTVGVVVIAGALSVSNLRRSIPSGPRTPTTTADPIGTTALMGAAKSPQVPVVETVTAVSAPTRRSPSPAPVPPRGLAQHTAEGGDVTGPDAEVGIAPLPEPIPITDRPLEIEPLVIQPVTNREIQIPLIETARPQKTPDQIDKR